MRGAGAPLDFGRGWRQPMPHFGVRRSPPLWFFSSVGLVWIGRRKKEKKRRRPPHSKARSEIAGSLARAGLEYPCPASLRGESPCPPAFAVASSSRQAPSPASPACP